VLEILLEAFRRTGRTVLPLQIIVHSVLPPLMRV
jgi:hypothetical protein